MLLSPVAALVTPVRGRGEVEASGPQPGALDAGRGGGGVVQDEGAAGQALVLSGGHLPSQPRQALRARGAICEEIVTGGDNNTGALDQKIG